MAIESVQIATNRYAPNGSEDINLYNCNDVEGLTFAQTFMSVCLRAAAACEDQSVLKMNAMTSGSQKLSEASDWMEKIVDEAHASEWAAAKAFLTGTMGIPESDLPPDLNSYDKRMQAANALKARMDALTQSQQENMIDLQTLVNRRDVAYGTSSNVIRALGTSFLADAANYL